MGNRRSDEEKSCGGEEQQAIIFLKGWNLEQVVPLFLPVSGSRSWWSERSQTAQRLLLQLLLIICSRTISFMRLDCRNRLFYLN